MQALTRCADSPNGTKTVDNSGDKLKCYRNSDKSQVLSNVNGNHIEAINKVMVMQHTAKIIIQRESICNATALFVVVMSALLCSGCQSKTTVTPQLRTNSQIIECFQGTVVHDGNKQYVPRTVTGCDVIASNVEYVYKYDTQYFATPIAAELGAAFIPTTIVGTPTGNDLLKVVASLDITACKKKIKKFEASCELRSYRGVFAGATDNYSLRKQCLLLVRDNIEQQMLAEKSLVESLGNCSQ